MKEQRTTPTWTFPKFSIRSAMRAYILSMLLWSPNLAYSMKINGNEGGGGGNTSVAEFAQIARAIGTTFISESKTPFGKSGKELSSLIDQTEIQPDLGPLKIDGEPVDAINYPLKNLVVLDITRWPGLSVQKKVLLVIHEYLGLLGRPDPRYVKSSEILNQIIKFDTGDWTTSFQKLLTMSQPDSLTSVECKVFEKSYSPSLTFDLEPLVGGLGSTRLLNKDTKIEVSVMFGPRRQVTVDVYPPCSKKVKCEGDAIGGPLIVSVTSNFIGEFVDIEMQLPKFTLVCAAK